MIDTLLTVPSQMAGFLNDSGEKPSWFARFASEGAGEFFVHTDPPGKKLGSGGGTVNLLTAAWQRASKTGQTKSSAPPSLAEWLGARQRLVLHSGGESRRLPAYAGIGKAFLPLPSVGGISPHCFDHLLADEQLPSYRQTLAEAGQKAAVLVSSGDVWLDFDPLQMPVVAADICGVGMQVPPEVAQHFGVFFVKKSFHALGTHEREVAFFLQKPAPSEIYRHAVNYDYFVDTGMWLLSVAATELLFARCGWENDRQEFNTPDRQPAYLDLYTEIGAALGSETKAPKALSKLGFRNLKTSVVALTDAKFYHLGSSRQLLESLDELQTRSLSSSRAYFTAAAPENFALPARAPVWIDGAASAETPVVLGGYNLLTGLPRGARVSALAAGLCLDVSPTEANSYIVRPYHIDDALRGAPGAGGKICGQDATLWLERRGFDVAAGDVFDLALYPVVPATEVSQTLVDWFVALEPDTGLSAYVASLPRVSAADIAARINYARYFAERRAGHETGLKTAFTAVINQGEQWIFGQDFSAIAHFCTTAAPSLKKWLVNSQDAILGATGSAIHQSRFLMLLAELTAGRAKTEFTAAAYARLQTGIISSDQLAKAHPVHTLKDDQIVWARSPVRLDFGGGWTDTPPYCLEQGGAVVNVAVLLNGQPPIQVFVRPIRELVIRIRSIDLGAEETITSQEGLAGYRDPRSAFSLPKAALALAGFHPDFFAGKPHASLRAQLKLFGSGLEMSLLSAVPKGSGLGTSSILGATLLGALNRACGLGWDEVDLYNRVLGVEQLLTTGGGWQDQAGALFRSLKLVQTSPGAGQTPAVRYLPEHLLGPTSINQTYLLYYTGATRLAKGILKEIVRDMFLGSSSTLHTLDFIRSNAWQVYHALQEGNVAAFQRGIARSWTLNQRLDSGTTTPEIQRIIATCDDDLSACKLLGAGGGGYMLICARDATAGARIRARLEANPPNSRARFIDFAVAQTGLQVSVS